MNQNQQDLLSNQNDLENLSLELQEQQDRLAELKRQQEEVERRKRMLEELNYRRDEVVTGQREMRQNLTRAVTILERSEYETRRELEQIQATREAFSEHLNAIEEITPAQWEPHEVEGHLNTSITVINNARAIYAQARSRVEALASEGDGEEVDLEAEDEGYTSGVSFVELLYRGFAFSLPLMILLSIITFILVTQLGGR